jgi:hypothetical protein
MIHEAPDDLEQTESHGALLEALRELEISLNKDSLRLKERFAQTATLTKYSPNASIALPNSLGASESLLAQIYKGPDQEDLQTLNKVFESQRDIKIETTLAESELEKLSILSSKRLALLYASDPTPRPDLIEALDQAAGLYIQRSMYVPAMDRSQDALSLAGRSIPPLENPSLLVRLHVYVAFGQTALQEYAFPFPRLLFSCV